MNLHVNIQLIPKTLLQMSHSNVFFSSWTEDMWPFNSASSIKDVLQILHSNWFFPSWTVEMCNLMLQIMVCKTWSANTSCVWLFLFMNWRYVSLQSCLLKKANFTNFTFEQLFSFMKGSYMEIQALFLFITSLTWFTLELFLFSIRRKCMLIWNGYWCEFLVINIAASLHLTCDYFKIVYWHTSG